MLREALEWMTTPAPAIARKLGYLGEAIATGARGRRQARAWQSHRERTRAALLAACEGLGGTAALLGAGLIDDIPLEELSRRFDKLVLVDIVHLAPVKRAARLLGNIELVCADLTGMAPALYRWQPGAALPQPAPAALAGRNLDFIASVNIAGQLPVIPLRRLGRYLDEAQAARLEEAIIGAHFDHLGSFKCPALFVGEVERRYSDRSGSTETAPALPGVILPTAFDEWMWPLAPFGEINRNTALECRVQAVKLTG
jgi:hypothetical protein